MTNPMHGPNPFKIGVFSANSDGGLTLTKVPERWPAIWSEIVEVAQMADRAGLEFFLPIARWKGYGGETNSRSRSYETLTFAAALAGVTKNIALFSTVHVPMVHPVFAAKALATVDQASGGRAGLNIVAGWKPEEFRLFGLDKVDEPYAQAAEWIEVIEKLYTSPEPFDHHGRYYKVEGGATQPWPVQAPRPVVLNAAFSPPGREFAAKHADFLFTTFSSIEAGRATIDDMAQRAVETGRDVGVYTTTHVVCRPTRAEAEDYYDRYTVREVDRPALEATLDERQKHAASHDPETFLKHQRRFAGGAGTYPLIGTPRDIAEEMIRMHEAGFKGTTVSFVNFKDELPFFLSGVLPILEEAGIRHRVTEAAA